MQIEYLADHLELAPVLADWHYAEWARLMPEWSLEEAQRDLRSHTQRRHIPTTLVALEERRLLGSVSLIVKDLVQWQHLSPWLASLYVVPERRGQGIGRELVRRAVLEAREMRVPKLHLFTAGQEAYYQRLGWRRLALAQQAGQTIAIMDCSP